MTSLFGGLPKMSASVQGTVVPETFTATAGQTVFNLTLSTYKQGTGSLQVYVDGRMKSLEVGEYSETSTSSFTLATPATLGQIVRAITYPKMDLTYDNTAKLKSSASKDVGAGMIGFDSSLAYDPNTVGNSLKTASSDAAAAVVTANAANVAVNAKTIPMANTGYKGLRITATGLDSKLTLSAQKLALESTVNPTTGFIGFSNCYGVIDFTLTGNGGLEYGSPTASAFYAIWAISTTSGGVTQLRWIANPIISLTGNVATGSPIISGLSSTSRIQVGAIVQNSLIPGGIGYVLTVDSASQVTISAPFNGNATGTTFTMVSRPTVANISSYRLLSIIQLDSTANKYPLSFIQNENQAEYIVAGNVTGYPVISSGAQGSPSTPTWVPKQVRGNFAPFLAVSVKLLLGIGTAGTMLVAKSASQGNNTNASNPPDLVTGASTDSAFRVEGTLMLTTDSVQVAANIAQAYLNLKGWTLPF